MKDDKIVRYFYPVNDKFLYSFTKLINSSVFPRINYVCCDFKNITNNVKDLIEGGEE